MTDPAPVVPPTGDPTFRWTQVAPRLAIEVEQLRALIERLDADFSPPDWGFAQLSDVTDVYERAIVSDQIRGAADAVATNLFEVRLHEEDFNALIPSDGLKMPDDVASMIDRARLDMHVAGFFRAFGSVLDCLAALTIGMLRVPCSIQRADFNDLRVLAPSSKKAKLVEAEQRSAWSRVGALLDSRRVGPPTDWLDWSLELRNALLHRGRNFTFNFMRDRASKIEIVSEEFPTWVLRFDPYLLAKPWLPDMVMFPEIDKFGEAVILEPATNTLRGLLTLLNELVEAVARLLHELWDEASDGRLKLAPPATAWDERYVVDKLVFEGFAPAFPKMTEMRVSPADAPRLQLGTLVRESLPHK